MKIYLTAVFSICFIVNSFCQRLQESKATFNRAQEISYKWDDKTGKYSIPVIEKETHMTSEISIKRDGSSSVILFYTPFNGRSSSFVKSANILQKSDTEIVYSVLSEASDPNSSNGKKTLTYRWKLYYKYHKIFAVEFLIPNMNKGYYLYMSN